MKRKFRSAAMCLALLAGSAIIQEGMAQKVISQQNFQLVKPVVKLNYVAFTQNDFAKSTTKTVNDLITLPNGKKVTLKEYLATINNVEKNLSDLGYSRDRVENQIVLSRLKSAVPDQTLVPTLTAKPLIAKSALTTRFTLVPQTSIQAIPVSSISRVKISINADKLPNDTITRNETFNIPQFKVAGYGVKIDASFTMKGIVDPFSLLDRQIHQDSLNRLITTTNNEYSMGFNLNVAGDFPQIGSYSVYSIESLFSTKANGSIKSKARLKVMDQILIDENRTVNSNKYRFLQNQVYNTTKLLAATNVFMYGLNFLSPVDFYISSNAVGADFDVTMTKTGVQGTAGPVITQSMFMESSVTELLGPGGEFFDTDVLDAGVGGELRLLEGGLDFGGNMGLAVENGTLKLKNDAYKAVDFKLLRGRLYTYYAYPKYVCDNIFGALDINCWITNRVENNLFDSGTAIRFQKVLFDENDTRPLSW